MSLVIEKRTRSDFGDRRLWNWLLENSSFTRISACKKSIDICLTYGMKLSPKILRLDNCKKYKYLEFNGVIGKKNCTKEVGFGVTTLIVTITMWSILTNYYILNVINMGINEYL
jgi:hypothetical protein